MKHVQHMIGFSALALSGCTFDEGLRERDITGMVRIPVEALTTLELIDPDGTPIVQDGFTVDEEGNPVLDITEQFGLLGPVYLGGFPSVQEGDYAYPHPEMGPILDPDRPGNTYPYGGTSVGRFDYACYEQLAARSSRVATIASSRSSTSSPMWSRPIIAPDGGKFAPARRTKSTASRRSM